MQLNLPKILIALGVVYVLFGSDVLENFWGWGWGYPNYGHYYGRYRRPYRRMIRRRLGYPRPYWRGPGYWW